MSFEALLHRNGAEAPCFGDEVIAEDGDIECFKEDVVAKSNDETDTMEEHKGIPVDQIPKAVQKELVEPWKNAHILKF